jgi:serine/threonine protein kinase
MKFCRNLLRIAIEVLTINQQGLTTITVTVGTPGYMPSEEINSRLKLSSDIYAVEIVGIKALTGKELKNLPRDKNRTYAGTLYIAYCRHEILHTIISFF